MSANSDGEESPPVALITTKSGRAYEVISSLGAGALGQVKKCRDRESGRICAVKVVDRQRKCERQLEQAKAEATLLQRFSQQPYVLGLEAEHERAEYEPLVTPSWGDAGRHHGAAAAAAVEAEEEEEGRREVSALVLELCQCDLFALVAAGALAETTARTLFGQLLDALEALHSSGCYHRDIKPENIMISADGSLRLGDFNLAVIPAAGLRDGAKQLLLSTEVGSRGYMAPEVIAAGAPGGGHYTGAAADLWSAGVVLFTMLAGHPPFQVADRSCWYFKRACISAKPEGFWAAHEKAGARLSPEAMGFLTKLLVANPKSRATIEELRSDPWLTDGAMLSPGELEADVARIVDPA